MDQFKININPPKVSDEQALKHMDFSKVMNTYQAMKLPYYKTLRFWLWTAGGFTALIALIVLLNLNFSTELEGTNFTMQGDTIAAPGPALPTEPTIEKPVAQPTKTTYTETAEITTKDIVAIEKNFIIHDKTRAKSDSTSYTEKKVVIAKPVVAVCGKGNGETVHKMQLGTVGKLTAEIKEINEKLTVVSFDMDYLYKGKTKTLHADSYKLSKEMLYATDDMKAGDTVRFYNIQATRTDGKTYLLDEISLIIGDGSGHW